ncbi:enoyl-CoA hydratase-related protein [Desulfoscipio geothermicus]|uniref:short-chain-enoyl-CoA hydratase n=1 Tax=Desulfoscipio geothermicus DSM 3669 TaxID=1121426 RepID=A0A1I6DGZ1_9FIRM|nr:enoyl-CoA hydratase-related protein [Desulfoscipio geothermicus]SFR04651.1 enoyl-CoA hydratase [Desulfoscipio geothermicus DSM 3669]
MDFQNLLLEKDGHIAVITLNRPEVRNALDPQTWAEIRGAIRECRFDQDVRVVIITGAGGKAFASGADIRSLRERETLEVLKSEAQESLNDVENLDKPVIAAIDGFALGGGCELAMACDIRIATSRSKLGQPEVNLGIIPGAGGTQRLQRIVGIGKAKELIFTGDILTAQEAVEIGLVNKVVDQPEDLLPAAKEMAQKIIAKGPVAVSLAKLSINVGANTDINSGLLFEKFAQVIAFSTDDRIEGTTAFLEKRKPDFKGK